MAITYKSVDRNVAIGTDAGVKYASGYVINSEAFPTLGMRGKKILVQPEVTMTLTIATAAAFLGCTIQVSMDGTNFVDSPATAITPNIATTSATTLAVGVKTPYVVDLTDQIAPYIRAVWKGYQSDTTTQRNITAGAIKTSFCISDD